MFDRNLMADNAVSRPVDGVVPCGVTIADMRYRRIWNDLRGVFSSAHAVRCLASRVGVIFQSKPESVAS